MIDILVKSNKTVIKVDSQMLSSLEKCPRRFYLEFIEDLESKFKAKALRKGSIIADALDIYYTYLIAGKPKQDGIIKALEYIQKAELIDAKHESAMEQRLMLTRRFAEYCTKYNNDYIIPISSETGFSVSLYEDEDLLILYEGKPDLTFHFDPTFRNNFGDHYAIRPMDHKTEASHRALHGWNNQFLGYAYALKSDMIIVNYIGFQKSKDIDDILIRDIIRYTREDLIDWRDNAIRNIKNVLKFREENYYPKQRANCDTKYGLCIFTRICDVQQPWTIEARKKLFYHIRESKWSAWETKNTEEIEEE